MSQSNPQTQNQKAILLLQNGDLFVGQGIGQSTYRYGECVFTTAMTGYSESLSDPSYAGQILCFAHPLIGNYGVSNSWLESESMFADGVIISSISQESFHRDQDMSLEEFLIQNKRGGIVGIDTRQLVKTLRDQGNQASILIVDNADKIDDIVKQIQSGITFQELTQNVDNPQDIGFLDWPKRVNEIFSDKMKSRSEFVSNPDQKPLPKNQRIIVLDCGVKNNIIGELEKRMSQVIIAPANTTASQIMELKPDGVLLSNGPGDPRDYDYIIATVKELLKNNLPIMGICLGHQILSLAIGAKVFKMKFGNRGGNQPVQDLLTQKAYLTSQNHGYAVDPSTIPNEYRIYFENLNDNSVEGIISLNKPIFSVQFHPEACSGPQDTNWLFDEFVGNIRQSKKKSNSL